MKCANSKLLNAIRSFYRDVKACVAMNCKLINRLDINEGRKQRCAILIIVVYFIYWWYSKISESRNIKKRLNLVKKGKLL